MYIHQYHNTHKINLSEYYPKNNILPLEGISFRRSNNYDSTYIIADDVTRKKIAKVEVIIEEDNVGYICGVSTYGRGSGVGLCQFMLKTFINYYHVKYGCRDFRLFVLADNDRALHIYHKLGFKIVETRLISYVGRDVAAHFMRLELKKL